MLSHVFRKPTPPVRPAAVPPGTRVYAIGDIHGRVDLLHALLDRIQADAASHSGRRILVFLGDYIDRGPDSRRTLETLIDSPLMHFEVIALMGNHERTLLNFLHDVDIGPMWFRNGGLDTLVSYGVHFDDTIANERARLTKAQEELRARLPARHRAFLESLRPWHIEGDYLFVHAGIRPGKPLEQQVAKDLLWIREEFLESEADHGYIVVHGHSITDEPETRVNRIGVDTGAYRTGRLTCLCLEGTSRRFIATGRST